MTPAARGPAADRVHRDRPAAPGLLPARPGQRLLRRPRVHRRPGHGHCPLRRAPGRRQPRTWARRQTVTGPAHVHRRGPARARYEAAGAADGTGSDDGLARNLADYDARFSVDIRLPRPPRRGVSLQDSGLSAAYAQ